MSNQFAIMLDEVILASRNAGKIKEFKILLRGLVKKMSSLCKLDSVYDVIENGNTYSENALKKARHISILTGKICLADDSGLEVEVLDGKPGIFSSRFAGEESSDEGNIAKLLSQLINKTNRKACFVCSLALVFPDGRQVIAEGQCEGTILHKTRGTSGFGYDPVFFLKDLNKTMAELTLDEKNQISHRARAVRVLKRLLCK
ncbi:MAG: XTP/dITP diphosphatase [Thermodesulfobacteriota bacterium]